MGNITYLKDIYLQIVGTQKTGEFTQLFRYFSNFSIGGEPILYRQLQTPENIDKIIATQMFELLSENNDTINLKNGDIKRSYIRDHVFKIIRKTIAGNGKDVKDHIIGEYVDARNQLQTNYKEAGITFQELEKIIEEIKDPISLLVRREITESEAQELYKKWKKDEENLKENEEKILSNYKRLILKRIRIRHPKPSHLDEDLLQEGYIAMMRALKTYDPTKASFAHYAARWIDTYIDREVTENNILKRGIGTEKRWYKVHTAIEKLGTDDPEIIAQELGLPIGIVKRRLSEPKIEISSIDAMPDSLHTSYNPMTAFENLTDEKKAKEVDTILQTLSIREQDIFKKRYAQDMTLQEIGNHYGVTRERIRQVIKKIHKNLSSTIKKENFTIIDISP
jgi:RNA polymerase sigma factor (sigma-70 family)